MKLKSYYRFKPEDEWIEGAGDPPEKGWIWQAFHHPSVLEEMVLTYADGSQVKIARTPPAA